MWPGNLGPRPVGWDVARRRSGPAIVHFTRAAIARPVVHFLDKLGCPTWRYLAEAHLSPALLEDPGAPVPVRLVHDFAMRASRAEGIDHLGLRVAESLTLRSLGTFGQMLARSRNVFDYLQTGCRLIPRLTTNQRFRLKFEEEQVRFCEMDTALDDPLEAYLFTLDLTIRTIQSVAGERWIPAEVLLPGEVPPGLADLSPVLANVRGDRKRPYASFSFPRAFLTLPMRPGRPEGTPPERLDFTTAQPAEFGESVRRLAESLVHDGNADLPTAAEAAGLSLRTFQRRVAECGLSFSKLVLEARITLSEIWLRERNRTITDVALSLGYNDVANFTRAFRRVNGLSPRAYRIGLDPWVPGI